MSATTVQISPEDFRAASNSAKESQQALVDSMAGTARTTHNSHYTALSTNGMQVESISNVRTFKADDLARPGIVGSLGAHKQHDGAIVKLIGGIDTTLVNAHNMGLIGKDSSGQYYDFDGFKKTTEQVDTLQDTQQETPKEATTEPQFNVSEPTLGSLAALSEVLPDYHVDQLLETAANHAMVDNNGNPVQLNLSGYSQMTGISEQDLHGHVGTVLSGYQAAADNALRAQGVDTERFYQFLRDEHPVELKKAMRQHYFTKDANVWKSLVPLYRTSVLPTDSALTKAGVKVGHNNGESFVTVGGVQMSVKAAAKAGVL